MSEAVTMTPIGFARTPYTQTSQIPKGPGAKHTAEGVIEIAPELEQGLTDIEGFSHLYVIWLFHRAEGFDLMATPPTDAIAHGVFATRAPRRPNPIGLHRVEVVAVAGATLRVRDLEAVDGTPVLDLKPVLASEAGER